MKGAALLAAAWSVLVGGAAWANGSADVAVDVTPVRIPVALPSRAAPAMLSGNVYRPTVSRAAVQATSLGLIVLSHGTPSGAQGRQALVDHYGPQAKALAAQGYVVVTALRRGYGVSDGPLADQYGRCDDPNYLRAAQESARDVAAVMAYGQALPQVDAARTVLIGKSAGGFASLAVAALNPQGLLGTVNFAGGRGSQPQLRAVGQICGEPLLLSTLTSFAATTQRPQLWIYAENDHYFAPALVSKMLAVYQQAGVPVTMQWVPPSGQDGHRFFDAPSHIHQWLPSVQKFLTHIDPGNVVLHGHRGASSGAMQQERRP